MTIYATTPWSQRMVEGHGIKDFYSNKTYKATLSASGWDYVTGLVANSVIKAWEMYPTKIEYYTAVKTMADKCITTGIAASLGTSNIDDLAAGKMFFSLYRKAIADGNATDAAKYKDAVSIIRNKLKLTHARIAAGLPGAGGFYHKASYPSQMWLDGLYMGPAVYAQWQAEFGKSDSAATNTASWSDIALQFKILNKYTYDSIKQLNYHAWAAIPTDANAFWSNQSAPYLGCSKEFWGRSMGWMFAALVDVLEQMPKDHPDYNEMVRICKQVASGLKRWQDAESGVWFQLLQYDASKLASAAGDPVTGYNKGILPNYLESSCSSMFTYAFFKAARLGLIDGDVYYPVARKAYAGLLKTFITDTGTSLSIGKSCASAGLGPSSNLTRSGTVNYYLCGSDVTITQNEGKAIGPFIMASLEYEQYQADSLKATHIRYPNASCCQKECSITVPTDGIYMLRFTSSDTLPYTLKSSCKAGENHISYSQSDQTKQVSCEVFSAAGQSLFKKEL
jgi:unsaturated rhamnogalacturonyl hydrolase